MQGTSYYCRFNAALIRKWRLHIFSTPSTWVSNERALRVQTVLRNIRSKMADSHFCRTPVYEVYGCQIKEYDKNIISQVKMKGFTVFIRLYYLYIDYIIPLLSLEYLFITKF